MHAPGAGLAINSPLALVQSGLRMPRGQPPFLWSTMSGDGHQIWRICFE